MLELALVYAFYSLKNMRLLKNSLNIGYSISTPALKY